MFIALSIDLLCVDSILLVFNHIYTHTYIYAYVCLFVTLSVYLSACLLACPSACLYVYVRVMITSVLIMKHALFEKVYRLHRTVG